VNFYEVFHRDSSEFATEIMMESGSNEPPDPAGRVDQAALSPNAAVSSTGPTRVSTPVGQDITAPSHSDTSVDMPVSPVMPTLSPVRPLPGVIPQELAPSPQMESMEGVSDTPVPVDMPLASSSSSNVEVGELVGDPSDLACR
jgi:hypothetical protein